MDTIRRTIDLEEELGTVREQIETLEESLDEVVEEAVEARRQQDDEDDEDDEEYELLEAKHDVLEGEIINMKGFEQALERAVEEWDGSEVVIKELSAYETRLIRDKVKREAIQRGMDLDEGYPDGKHEIEFMQRAVVSTPEGAPEPDKVQTVPDKLYQYLLNRANAVNSVGELTVGNSSLSQKVAERTG